MPGVAKRPKWNREVAVSGGPPPPRQRQRHMRAFRTRLVSDSNVRRRKRCSGAATPSNRATHLWTRALAVPSIFDLAMSAPSRETLFASVYVSNVRGAASVRMPSPRELAEGERESRQPYSWPAMKYFRKWVESPVLVVMPRSLVIISLRGLTNHYLGSLPRISRSLDPASNY